MQILVTMIAMVVGDNGGCGGDDEGVVDDTGASFFVLCSLSQMLLWWCRVEVRDCRIFVTERVVSCDWRSCGGGVCEVLLPDRFVANWLIPTSAPGCSG